MVWFSSSRTGSFQLRLAGLLSTAVFLCPITVSKAESAWWNSQWRYRIPVAISADGYERYERPSEIQVNFTQALAALGQSLPLDENSIRVIEVDDAGAVINDAVPFQFDHGPGFDAAVNAAGMLIVLMNGTTPPGATRRFDVYFETVGGSFTPPSISPLVSVVENSWDEGQDAFGIFSGSATYYYQKEAGAFSSVVDADGNDWVNYNPDPGSGSAGNFRGIPNAVFPEGHFHPGATSSTSTVVSAGPLKATIHSVTNDGKWECTWEIFPRYARMTMLKADHNFWFLYEGAPGGVLDGNIDFSVRSTGESTPAFDPWTGDIPGNEWVYFTDPFVGRSLYFSHLEGDDETDSYYPLEGNMTVFGFGRAGTNTYLSSVPAHLVIGFMESGAFATSADTILSASKDLQVVAGTPERFDALPPVPLSPPDNAFQQPVTAVLVWSSSPPVTSYHIQVGTDSTFTSTVLNDSTIVDTSRIVSGLTSGTQYYWRVRTKNGSSASQFSATWDFLTALQTPAQVFPQNSSVAIPTNVTLRWSPVPGALHYHIQLGTDSTFVTGITKNDSTIVDTSRTVNGLAASTWYYWRIRARNGVEGSEFSSVATFRTSGQLPSPVVLAGPANGVATRGDTVVCIWRHSEPGVVRYWFEISPDSLFHFSVVDSLVADTSKVVRQLLPDATHWWRVRAWNSDGWGPFSETRTFVTSLTGVDDQNDVPTDFVLRQNYPNPFNPSTTISFTLPRAANIRLEVFSLVGQHVATLFEGWREAGVYAVTFTPGAIASGLYLYRLSAEGTVITRKMMVLK